MLELGYGLGVFDFLLHRFIDTPTNSQLSPLVQLWQEIRLQREMAAMIGTVISSDGLVASLSSGRSPLA